jgi:hypothetical protein
VMVLGTANSPTISTDVRHQLFLYLFFFGFVYNILVTPN